MDVLFILAAFVLGVAVSKRSASLAV